MQLLVLEQAQDLERSDLLPRISMCMAARLKTIAKQSRLAEACRHRVRRNLMAWRRGTVYQRHEVFFRAEATKKLPWPELLNQSESCDGLGKHGCWRSFASFVIQLAAPCNKPTLHLHLAELHGHEAAVRAAAKAPFELCCRWLGLCRAGKNFVLKAREETLKDELNFGLKTAHDFSSHAICVRFRLKQQICNFYLNRSAEVL